MGLAKTACKNALQVLHIFSLLLHFSLLSSFYGSMDVLRTVWESSARCLGFVFSIYFSFMLFTIMWTYRERRRKFLSGMPTLEAVELILTNFAIISNSDLYVQLDSAI